MMLQAKIKEIRLKLLEERVLLSDIDFTLDKNHVYSILGKNGSGKSTLIRSLTGLLDKRFYSVNGKVIFEEKDLLTANEKDILQIRKDKIKYVFQDALNSFDQLKKFKYYFEKIAKDISEAEALLKYFLLPGPDKLFKLYPYEVSGGMAQRISFVLALLANPKIIFLDEPTSGIDAAISNLFLLKLKEFASQEDRVIVLTTHDLQFAKKSSDKIAFMSDGKISEFYLPDIFFSEKPALSDSFLNSYNRLLDEQYS